MNLLDIWFNGQKITSRRLGYTWCHCLMIFAAAFQNVLAFHLLITNYLVDFIKDIVQLFQKDKTTVDYIYKYKPVFLATTYMVYIITYRITLAQMLLPLFIVGVSAFDTLIDYRTLLL